MSRKAFTFRIEPDELATLARLSKVLRRPMNKLVNEAVKAYLKQRVREAERDLEASLASLRAYRQKDPDFEQAIAAFVAAEATVEDPIVGEQTDDSGPVRTEIQRLLNA